MHRSTTKSDATSSIHCPRVDSLTPTPADPWLATIFRLTAATDPDIRHLPCPNLQSQRSSECQTGRSGSTRSGSDLAPILTLVERISDRSVLVTWRSATIGQRCEQQWICKVARTRGLCALSGCLIVRGDRIYAPSLRVGVLRRKHALMVLADRIDNLECGSSHA